MSDPDDQAGRDSEHGPYREDGGRDATADRPEGGAGTTNRMAGARRRAPAPGEVTEQAWFASLVANTSDLVIAFRRDGTMVFANPSARRFGGFGRPDEAELGVEDVLDETTLQRWREVVTPLLRSTGKWVGEMTGLTEDGRAVPLLVEVQAHHGGADLISIVGRDISQTKAVEAQLTHEASDDPLTRLPNRTLFLDRLDTSVARSQRTDRTFAVLFCDLDHFKAVNDRLGHDLGDEVLVALAERLAATIRPGDTVARLSGDEFVVLCQEVDQPGEAEAIAARIAAAIAEPTIIDGQEVTVTASIGIALAEDAESAEALLRDADAAMYEAKDRDRARAALFGPSVRTRSDDRLALETDLRQALERDQLRVHYQVMVDLGTGRPAGIEALLRWDHPERGLLRPGAFLPLAETNAAMVPIGRWLAAQACAAVRHLEARLPRLRPLLCTLNLSPTQLLDPDLVDDLRTTLIDSGVSADQMRLEVTEHVLTDIVDITDSTIGRLQDLGVHLALDDFGGANAQLGTFARYPVDLVKLDGSLTAGLGGSRRASTVEQVTTLVDGAHELGLRTVAEGVESAAQVAELRRAGCDLAQGYFLAHPLPLDELGTFLATDPVWWVFDAPPEDAAAVRPGEVRTGVWLGWRP